MRTPWTMSTLEAVIFSGLVLGLSGAVIWQRSCGEARAQAPC
jgi:hypothetical protein